MAALKQVVSRTSSGGTLTQYFDRNGNRVRAVHAMGNREVTAPSGKKATRRG